MMDKQPLDHEEPNNYKKKKTFIAGMTETDEENKLHQLGYGTHVRSKYTDTIT